MLQLRTVTAVYENGVLKLQGPVPGLADGDRVEIALVRVAPIDYKAPSEVARGERIAKAHEELMRSLPPDPDDDYDVVEAMNATRLSRGERPLIPPTEAR